MYTHGMNSSDLTVICLATGIACSYLAILTLLFAHRAAIRSAQSLAKQIDSLDRSIRIHDVLINDAKARAAQLMEFSHEHSERIRMIERWHERRSTPTYLDGPGTVSGDGL